MARRRKDQLIPILTDEQRSRIRMGWRMPGAYSKDEREWEREHAQRIADRAELTGLAINPRHILNEIAQRPRRKREEAT